MGDTCEKCNDDATRLMYMCTGIALVVLSLGILFAPVDIFNGLLGVVKNLQVGFKMMIAFFFLYFAVCI